MRCLPSRLEKHESELARIYHPTHFLKQIGASLADPRQGECGPLTQANIIFPVVRKKQSIGTYTLWHVHIGRYSQIHNSQPIVSALPDFSQGKRDPDLFSVRTTNHPSLDIVFMSYTGKHPLNDNSPLELHAVRYNQDGLIIFQPLAYRAITFPGLSNSPAIPYEIIDEEMLGRDSLISPRTEGNYKSTHAKHLEFEGDDKPADHIQFISNFSQQPNAVAVA